MDYTLEQPAPTQQQRGVFLQLLLVGILGIFVFSFATVIYTLPTLNETMNIDTAQLPPNAVLVAIATIQPALLVALAIWAGLFLSKRMSVNITPILTGAIKQTQSLIVLGLGSGFVAGLLMLAVHQFIFLPITEIPVNAATNYPAWLGMIVVLLYGGIVEELLIRLGVMTLLLWIGTKIQGASSPQVENHIFWIVNIIVTIIFGLLHVVSAPVLLGIEVTSIVVVQALVLNSVSLLFGWLYWHKGLETAILSHMGFHLGYTLIAFLFI